MNWIEEHLEPTEQVIFVTRPHGSMFLLPLALLGMSLVGWWMAIPATLLLGYDLFIFFSHQTVLTTDRVIQKHGLYYIRLQDWPLRKIEDVICIQTVADRLFGSGSVVLMGIAISKCKLSGIGRPKQLRHAIYSQLPTR